MAKTERVILSQAQENYLEWLLTPKEIRKPKTKKQWALDNGIHYNTLGQWEKNKTFAERWSLGVKGLTASPERTQALLDALYAKGIAGDVRSAELYLKATGQMQNVSTVNIKSTDVKDLSDAELDALIAETAQTLKENKNSRMPELKMIKGDVE